MADFFVANASSGTVLAEKSAPAAERRLVLQGVLFCVNGGGSTASVLTFRYGDSSANVTSVVFAVTTGGIGRAYDPGGFVAGRYVAAACTSNTGTSNSVAIWGNYA